MMARPPKRKATSDLYRKHSGAAAGTIYSTREPTVEEKLTLPEEFQDPETWPVERILKENRTKYCVDWKAHPNTGEIWRPSWVSSLHLTHRRIRV